MSARLEFALQGGPHGNTRWIEVTNLVIAGWTGRNKAEVERHVAELAHIGVKAPPSVPVFYRASATLLTQANRIQVVGDSSSGEVEFYLLATPTGCYVGVGSDHTDRKVEAYDITVSKQMCAKPVSRASWFLPDLLDHWDSLLVQAYVTRNGQRVLYQQGKLEAMLSPGELIGRYAGTSELPAGTLMFGGTIPVVGDVAGGERFEIALIDPRSGDRLEHAYDIDVLAPIEIR